MGCLIGKKSECQIGGCIWAKTLGLIRRRCDKEVKEIVNGLRPIPEKKEFTNPKQVKAPKTHKQKTKRYAVSKTKRQTVYIRGNGICYICGESVSITEFTVDHVIPISRGGSNDISNLRPTHFACNLKKGNKIITI